MKAFSQSKDIKSWHIPIAMVVSGLLLSYLLFKSPSYAPLALAFLIALIATNKNPILVFCIAFPALQIFYNYTYITRTETHLSLFDSFLLFCAFFLLFQLFKRKFIEEYTIYLPIFVCVLVLFLYVLIGHGDLPGSVLLIFLVGLWPLLLITQFLLNSKQLKAVVVVWLLTFVALSLLWLPALLSARSNWGQIHLAMQQTTGPYKYVYEGTSIYLVKYTAISYQNLLAMAISIPAFLGIAFTKSRIRYLAYLALPLIAATIMLSTFLAPFIAMLVGIVIFYSIYFWKSRALKMGKVLMLILILLTLSIVFLGNPLFRKTAERSFNFQKDPNFTSRVETMGLELRGLVETNPIIGYGSYKYEGMATVKGMRPFMGHSSFPSLAFEYGLLFFIPFIWIFVIIIKRVRESLNREIRTSADPFVIGMASAFFSALFSAFLDPVFLIPLTGSVVWLVAGLILVTNRNNELTLSPEAS